MQNQNWTLDRIINILLYLGGIVLFLFVLDYLSPYLVSFFLALLFAYLLEPVVGFFQYRLKIKKRWIAVMLTLFSIVIFITLVSLLVLPSMIAELAKLEKLLQETLTSIEYKELLPDELIERVNAFLASDEIKEMLNQENLTTYGAMVLGFLWKALSGAAGMLIGLFSLVTFLLYLVFIMLFYDDFADNWESAIPHTYRKTAVMLVKDVEREMQVYFRGQANIVLWVCILFAVGFELINLPLGILLGVFVGLLNFVPYLQMLGFIPAIALAAVQSAETGQGFLMSVGLVLLVFAVVQAIQEIVLVPRIMGEATGLNPAIILLSLSIWGGLFGIIGMVIALPMTSLLINYYKRFVLKEPLIPAKKAADNEAAEQ
jgi:predicted PurR-regulated permease PerM